MKIESKVLVSAIALACALPLAATAATGISLQPPGHAPAPAGLATAEHIRVPMDHAPVAVSWALPANRPINAAPTPFEQVSRQFLVNATGAELQRGVALPLTAAGDIVRISPLGAGTAAIDSARVQFVAGGHTLTAAQASNVLASGTQMRQAGMPIQRGSTVMKLADNVATGNAKVMAQGARGNYLIQVYEPKSPFALTLVANHGTRLAGEPLQLAVNFARPTTTAPGTAAVPQAKLDRVTGVLEAPDGWSESVRFTPGANGSYVANVTPPAAHAGERGLWEIHAFANGSSGGKAVLREATNAFAVVLPTARFDRVPIKVAAHAGRAVNVDVSIDVAAASRYTVSGVLYGHAKNGQLEPAVYAQSAAWLEPGRSVPIRLGFSAAALAKSGLAGPYQLRDLSLQDQVQLGVLDRRAGAARGLVAGR